MATYDMPQGAQDFLALRVLQDLWSSEPHRFSNFLVCLHFSQRQRLYEMAGAGQTPYLIDPNTGAKGYESSEINDYLDETYRL